MDGRINRDHDTGNDERKISSFVDVMDSASLACCYIALFCEILASKREITVPTEQHRAEHYSSGQQLLGHLIISQHFMEPEIQ